MKSFRKVAWSTFASLGAVAVLGNAALAAPDPTVSLTVVDTTTGQQETLAPGAHQWWFLGVGNVGDAAASGVVSRVHISTGLTFIAGSLVNVDPLTTTAQYSNDGGATWSYVPSVAAGSPDPAVTDVRLVANGALPAQGSGSFVAAGKPDFDLGSYDQTFFSAGQGIRINELGGASAGTYTTRAFPFQQEGRVDSWTHVKVEQTVIPGVADITYDILDGVTDTVIAGHSGLRPDTSGTLDLSRISALVHPALKVRANLVGQANECFTVLRDQSDPTATCAPDPMGLTASGQVFGNLWKSAAGCKEKGFTWTKENGMTVLQALEDQRFVAYAYAQNEAGAVVGESMTSTPMISNAVLWQAGSATPINLHSVGANTSSWATSISDNGKVAGRLGGALNGPFRWLGASMETLTVGQVDVNAVWDWRVLISSNGDVTGRYRRPLDAGWRAYVWKADGTFVDLAVPGDVAAVTGINASGWIIGYGADARDAWLYRPGQAVLAFSKADARFFVASGLNDAGTAVGSYVDAAGLRVPFSWTAAAGVRALDKAGWAQGEALGITPGSKILVSVYDTSKAVGPYSRLGFNQGGSTTLVTTPSILPEAWGTRQAIEGFRPFNESGKITGIYVPDLQVYGGPAEVPYYYGSCGTGAPMLASIRASYRGEGYATARFETVFEAGACADYGPAEAVVTSSSVDANPANNTAQASLWFPVTPDLGIVLNASPGVVAGQGEWLNWSVTVVNHGQSDVLHVNVDFELPAGLQLDWGPSDNAVSDLTVPAGQAVELGTIYGATVNADPLPESFTVTARLDAGGDCNPANDSATATTAVGAGPNLFVTGAATPISNTGGVLVYHVIFGNNGNDSFAEQAQLAVSLPAGAVLTEVTGTFDPPAPFPAPGVADATFTVDGANSPLAPGTTYDMYLTATSPLCIPTTDVVASTADWGDLAGSGDLVASDNLNTADTLLVGVPIDDGNACTTDTCNPDGTVTHTPIVLDCPADPLCAGTSTCDPTWGACAYNDLPLGADVDGVFCTVNERCEGGQVVSDVRTCTAVCSMALGAQCDLASDACVDVFDPAAPDQDFDGTPDACDQCAIDFGNCVAPLVAVHAVVKDARGQPAGTITCHRNTDTGDLQCETDPVTGELIVRPGLACGP